MPHDLLLVESGLRVGYFLDILVSILLGLGLHLALILIIIIGTVTPVDGLNIMMVVLNDVLLSDGPHEVRLIDQHQVLCLEVI